MAPLYNTREAFSNTALYTTIPRMGTPKDDPSTSCSICGEMCTFAFVGSTHHALQMPSCSHIFGASCIETWFDTASTCPLCRKHFFPMEPEEISTEMQELPDLFRQMFTLLGEVRKRYPQGRVAVTGMEDMIANLGEKIVEDIEERKKRKMERKEAEREVERSREKRQRDIQDLVRQRRQRRLQDIQDRPETEQVSPPPPPHQVSTTSSTEVTIPERVILGPDSVVSSSSALSTEAFRLPEAAGNVRRRRATVLNAPSATSLGQGRETGRLREDLERRRVKRLRWAAVWREVDERERMNVES